MTVNRARRVLGVVIFAALVVGLLGSVAFVLFAERLARYPTLWG